MHPFRRAARLGGITATALMLAGCAASMTVSSYVGPGVDFRQYSTYGWAPSDRLSTGDPRLDNNPFFDERVRTSVENQMATRGFEKSTSDAPDFLLHYYANVVQEVDFGASDPPYAVCEDCLPSVYEAGTLVIDIVDARTKTLAWRGWAEGSFEGVIDDQAWMEEKVDDAVERILARLPPRL